MTPGSRLRDALKFFGGSALVYAITTGLPSSEGTCNGARDTLAAAQAEQGGSQLVPTYLEAEDGSRQFLGWHDSVRGVDCAFTVAADGAWRCLPGGADASTVFADAACTQRLALVPKDCAPPAYAVVREAVSCDWHSPAATVRHVLALSRRFTGPLAYWKTAGTCAAISSRDATDLLLHDLYSVGDELPPSAFVRAVAQGEP